MHTSVIWLKFFLHHLHVWKLYVCTGFITHDVLRCLDMHTDLHSGIQQVWTDIFSQQFLTVFDSLGCFPQVLLLSCLLSFLDVRECHLNGHESCYLIHSTHENSILGA